MVRSTSTASAAEHSQLVEDEVATAVEMARDVKMNNYPGLFDLHQSSITEEEVIEAAETHFGV